MTTVVVNGDHGADRDVADLHAVARSDLHDSQVQLLQQPATPDGHEHGRPARQTA
jgi:hypothetical protein